MEAWIDVFLHYLRYERGCSQHTLHGYARDLAQFTQFLKGRPLQRQTLTEYATWLPRQGFKARTIARKLSAIRSFCHFLVADEYITEDPAALLRLPKLPRHLPKALPVTVIEKLLSVPLAGDKRALRDAAMLELLYATGLRVSELTQLDLEQVDLVSGLVRCMGKGAKERVLPLHDRAIAKLTLYLKEGRPSFKARGTAAVFLDVRGHRLTRQGVWGIIKQVAERGGVNASVFPHLFRHSFATHLLEGGMDLRLVQEMLGHEQIVTTEIYTKVSQDHLRKIYDQVHPRA